MQRRTVIAGMGTLLLAGCTSLSGSDAEETPEAEAPDTKFSFSSNGAGTVKIVHLGNDNIGNEATKKVAVTVNGERVPVSHNGEAATYLLADEDQLKGDESAAYPYPFSIGNVVTVPASPSDTVKIVWYPANGEKQTIEEYTVPEPTATPTAETTEATGTTEGSATTEATGTTEAAATTDATETTDA